MQVDTQKHAVLSSEDITLKPHFFFFCRLQISWELSGCVVIWPQTTRSTLSPSRIRTPCTSMPRLTSSGRDWCCQTLIALATRYCQTGESAYLLLLSTLLSSLSSPLLFVPSPQVDMFKKAGWTIVKPPTPLIPDSGFQSKTYLLLHQQNALISSLYKKHSLFPCRPPAVDVLQVAVHERPDVG